jgi:sucrose-6-phosphate hydrolase SacC (GH32 family)
VELFVGDGEVVLTEQLFPPDETFSMALYAQGGVAHFGALQTWPMGPAAVDPPP